MSRNELETIVLDNLHRMDAEAKEARQRQDETTRNIQDRVNDCERHLTRLSGLYQRLEPLVKDLDSILANGGRRKSAKQIENREV